METLRAGRADAEGFYRLEARVFEMDWNSEDTEYYWVPILEHQCCHKAVEDGIIVGGIVSMPTFNREWYINSLFVDPEYRRRGIATKLMECVMRDAWHQTMVLDVKTDRPHLLEFYKSFGFKTEGRSHNHYGDGEDRFIMRRRASCRLPNAADPPQY